VAVIGAFAQSNAPIAHEQKASQPVLMFASEVKGLIRDYLSHHRS
jgi:hypothetical protein